LRILSQKDRVKDSMIIMGILEQRTIQREAAYVHCVFHESEMTLDKGGPERFKLRGALLLLWEWHVVAIGIILVVVGVVGQRVGDVISLSVVRHALVMIG